MGWLWRVGFGGLALLGWLCWVGWVALAATLVACADLLRRALHELGVLRSGYAGYYAGGKGDGECG